MSEDVKRALIHAENALWDGASANGVILAFLRAMPDAYLEDRDEPHSNYITRLRDTVEWTPSRIARVVAALG